MEELYKFMYWGDYDAKIQILADMTDEKWSFIVKINYIKYKKTEN